jgi:chemotaxis protein CheX
MNIEALLVPIIRRAVANVFSTMLQVEIAEGERGIESSTPDTNDGVVSFIGLTGAWAGTGSLACSPVLACRLCSQMVMSETTSVNEDVLDAIAELTNMIVGSVKHDLEEHVGPLALSIPTVVFGRNFRTKSAGSSEWVVMRFHWQDDLLVVKMCLAPRGKKLHAVAHSAAPACAVDV